MGRFWFTGKAIFLTFSQGGVSRSASVVIAYLIREKQMSYFDALYFVRSKRKFVSPNSGFCNDLFRFEQILLARRGETPM
jgi:protein-tyrosine phosphatase